MSETVVNIYEAKTSLSKLITRVEAGEEIVLARAGKPCARLVPLAPETPHKRVGLLPGLVIGPEFFEPLPDTEIAAWEGSR